MKRRTSSFLLLLAELIFSGFSDRFLVFQATTAASNSLALTTHGNASDALGIGNVINKKLVLEGELKEIRFDMYL